MSSIPLIIDFVLAFLERAWQISLPLTGFIMLSFFLYALYLNKDDIEDLSSYLSDSLRMAFGSLLVETGPNLVIAIIVSSLVSIVYSNMLAIYGSFALVAGVLLYLNKPKSDSPVEMTDWKSKSHVFISMILLIFIVLSFFPSGVLFQKIISVSFYGILFWRI